MTEVVARVLVDGDAAGDVVALDEPLSLWGGFDIASGRIIGRHRSAGIELAGRVVVMPSGRGSSSSSSVLAEAINAGTAPVAFVLREPDHVLSLGAIVARELYGVELPVVVVDADAYEVAARATRAHVERGGLLRC